MSKEKKKKSEIILNSDSVSLHIRRGDYAKDKKTNAYHGLLSLQYYHNAISKMSNIVNKPQFFIFSDDIKWVKENFKIAFPAIFILNSNDKAYEDLFLMTLCKNHIIANSSFSWWGAWLCTNPSKIVYAPKQWLAVNNHQTSDLIPKDWHRI